MNKGILKSLFGHLPDGTEIDLYTLTNANGLRCKIITYGATITEIRAPDRAGHFANIVLSYDSLEEYLNGKDYRGATVGRVANRIARACFTLNGKTHTLAVNDGLNHLHGGIKGFDKRVWRAWPQPDAKDAVGLLLRYESPDNEEGYPGDLDVFACYTLTDADELQINYTAHAKAPTLVNLTNHAYWNLAGKGGILRHELTMAADCYTPMDDQYIPTGKIESVEGTPFDFRSSAAIGGRLPSGYNANYVFPTQKRDKNGCVFAARARDPESGRVLELWTNQPGLQFYSGAFLSKPSAGFCLETQNFPDAIHHPDFPSAIFAPGRVYQHHTVCRFSAD
jgi:aldose 1-epimerase